MRSFQLFILAGLAAAIPVVHLATRDTSWAVEADPDGTRVTRDPLWVNVVATARSEADPDGTRVTRDPDEDPDGTRVTRGSEEDPDGTRVTRNPDEDPDGTRVTRDAEEDPDGTRVTRNPAWINAVAS